MCEVPVEIKVNRYGTTCDVVVPGQFKIMFTSNSIVEAIDFCEQNNYKYTIIWENR